MDALSADLALQAILGRGTDFVAGIDNEALDFSQLEDFINSEGSQGNNTYFNESLNSTPTSGKLLNVIVENKRNTTGHSLPESPPDSSSEHPYSPQEGCEPSINTTDNIYTTLGQTIYKPATIINPMLSDNLILGSHIVVAEQNGDQLLDNANILQDGRIIVNQNDAGLLQDRILLTDSSIPDNRQILLTNADSNQNFTDRTIYKGDDFDKNQHLVHLGYNAGIDVAIPRTNIENNICEPNLETIPTVYTNLQNAPKKRKLSQDSPLVKSEPEHCSTSQLNSPGPLSSTPLDEEYASSEACLSESQYQCIRFNAFQQPQWHALCDQNLTELPIPHYRVDADKGFNFSNADDAFVCQKKNHFQITCHVQLLGDAQFVKTPDGFQKISSFHIHFYGVKHDCPTQTIRVEQSQSDRSKKPFHPVLVELVNSQVTKITVGRLHFSETTSNNMRKKGKPNPEQRYFQLVVGLHAHTTTGNFPVISHASQKIIVRASNPGQFESDVELCWQKGQTQDSVFHNGKIGINTDRPDESLVVHGNIKITGHIIQPSDIRAKKNIVECDTAEQLKNVQKLRVVRYDYDPTFASQLSRDTQRSDTGVIAQEVAKVLPEAVRPAGDLILKNGTSIDNFLVVNKERIFMENIGAVKELCKVTDNLETRIDQLERINRRLNKLKRGDSLKSNSTVSSSKLSYSQKCSNKHHACSRDDELCSNKFIQIVIVVLVLIMAFCLAAITTLYLMEASRHNQFMHNNQQSPRRPLVTKRPMKSSKNYAWPTITPHHTTNSFKDEGISKLTLESAAIMKRLTPTIGRPSDCSLIDQDLESTNLCQIFCCAAVPPVIPPPELSGSIFTDKNSNSNRNKTGQSTLLNIEKNKIATPFHSNDIDKQSRQRRDAYDMNEEANAFETSDDQIFAITVQGRNFNTTITQQNLLSLSNSFNFTYIVPISKYMPDEFINLIFSFSHSSIKEVEHCGHDYGDQSGCRFDDKLQDRHKVNEFSSLRLLSSQSVIFEVDMADYQSKFMTYRASLKPLQNTCRLTALGLDFIEYNFYFFRRCDE